MIFGKLKMYAIVGLLTLTVVSMVGAKFLYDRNVQLKIQVETLTAARDKAKSNLLLVQDQLSLETRAHSKTKESLQELGNVPDETFNEKLPLSINNTILNFNDRMRSLQEE